MAATIRQELEGGIPCSTICKGQETSLGVLKARVEALRITCHPGDARRPRPARLACCRRHTKLWPMGTASPGTCSAGPAAVCLRGDHGNVPAAARQGRAGGRSRQGGQGRLGTRERHARGQGRCPAAGGSLDSRRCRIPQFAMKETGHDRPAQSAAQVRGLLWPARADTRLAVLGLPGKQMRTLSIGGRVLRVAARDGNPDWPPLLLCNGIGARLEVLQPFVDALDRRRAIIRFDMPGIGGSPAPALPYHLATLPPLLSGLLDQLGYQQADVLGISWGGGLAQQFALSRPDRVRRLVLVATGPGALMIPGHPRVLLRMLTPRRHHDPAHAARIAGELYGGSVRDDPALARDLLHRHRTPGPGQRLLLPARLRHRLDQPAAAAAAAAAHLDPGRRRRPHHPAGQRPDHAPADTAQRAAHLSRRPP